MQLDLVGETTWTPSQQSSLQVEIYPRVNKETGESRQNVEDGSKLTSFHIWACMKIIQDKIKKSQKKNY